MKIVWEAEDIKPGRRHGKPGRAERWIIGYLVADCFLEPAMDIRSARYCEISLADGAIQGPFSRQELAHGLNECGEMPEELL